MKSKKAILMPEVLKIILAVLSIILLIYLGVSLYGLFIKKTALQQAKITLEQISAGLEELEEGESWNYLVTSPRKWYLISYKEGEESPKLCQNKNCLCICDENTIKDCDDKGICKMIEKQVKITEMKAVGLNYEAVDNLRIGIINLDFKFSNNLIEMSSTTLTGADKEIFNNFLDTKYDFLDKGEISIEEQIKYYFNSGSAKAWRDGDARSAIINNIEDYFKDYQYPLKIYLTGEIYLGKGQINLEAYSEIKVHTGEDKKIKKDIKFPRLIIENREGAVKNIIVTIELRQYLF